MRGWMPVILLSLLLATVPPSSGLTAPRPTYAVGDYWLYSMDATLFSLSLHGSLNLTVEGFRTFRVNGTDFPVVTVLFEGEGTFRGEVGGELFLGNWTIQRSELWETQGYKVLHRYNRTHATGLGQTSRLNFTLEGVDVTTNLLLRDTWTFPVVAGSAGFVEANVTSPQWFNVTSAFGETRFAENRTYTERRNLTALEIGTISVPAGAWEVLRVNESIRGGWVEHNYSPAVGGDVRQEMFNETGASVSRLELLAYRYQVGGPPPSDPTRGSDLLLAVAFGGLVAGGGFVGFWRLRRRKRPPRWRSYEEELAEERDVGPPEGPDDPEGAPGRGGGSSSAGIGRSPLPAR